MKLSIITIIYYYNGTAFHNVVPFCFYAKMLDFEEFLKYTSHTSLKGSQPA